MGDHAELGQLLEDLGLGKTEAAAYVQLLQGSESGPATGYQVAKQLGKDPTTVYRALEDLVRRGAVETVAGRGRSFRPVDPAELTRRLAESYGRRAERAAAALANLPRSRDGDEVYRLHTHEQAADRFEELLAETTRVALLDLAPETFTRFRDGIAEALARGVAVTVKLYREPTEPELAGLEDMVFTVEPDGELMIDLMPGPVLHGVFDCAAQLVTYLTGDTDHGDEAIAQAFWTANRFLAYQAHSGLASEILHTELRAMLDGGNGPGEMKARQDWMAARIHGPVDWEEFWSRTGLMDERGAKRRKDALAESGSVPWEGPLVLRQDGSEFQTGSTEPLTVKLLRIKRRTLKMDDE